MSESSRKPAEPDALQDPALTEAVAAFRDALKGVSTDSLSPELRLAAATISLSLTLLEALVPMVQAILTQSEGRHD